jgi:hypothetical protein
LAGRKRRDVFGCDVSGGFRGSYGVRGGWRELKGPWKQLIAEHIYVDQNKKAAAPVRIERVKIAAVSALTPPDWFVL